MATINKSATFYLQGIQGSSSQSMNLYISGLSGIVDSGSIDLFLKGSTAGYNYMFKALPLFLNASPFSRRLNLFIAGTDVYRPVRQSLNLTITGSGTRFSKALNLVAWGSNNLYSLSLNRLTISELFLLTLQQLSDLPIDSDPIFNGYYFSKNLNLYLRGDGLYDNYNVYRSYINLYMNTGLGLQKTLNLFIAGKPVSTQHLDLYTSGVIDYVVKTLLLSLKSIGPIKRNLDLFARGFNP